MQRTEEARFSYEGQCVISRFGRSRWRDGRYRVFAGRLFLSYNIRF